MRRIEVTASTLGQANPANVTNSVQGAGSVLQGGVSSGRRGAMEPEI